MMNTALDFGKIITADLILSGDNALIISMVAAGLAVLIYVALEMFYRGVFDINQGIGPKLGLIEGYDLSKGGH